MTFLHPEFFYYMLLPLFILFGLLLTQKEPIATFFSQEVIDKLRVNSNTLTLKARNGLFFLIGLLMIVALAQPVIQDGVIEVKAKSADIMIAMDISDSMLAEDVYPNRLKLAKHKAIEMLGSANQDRVGVIAFAKGSFLVSPLSFDHSAVKFLLSNLNTDSITEKGTNISSMLEVVNQSMAKDVRKYILLLSDGGDKDDFSDEIALAKKYNITVFVLGVGTKKGAPVKQSDGSFIKQNGKIIISKLNEHIADLAVKSGGVYIQNTNSNRDINAMLKEIEKHSDKKELKSEDVQKYIPLFYYPVGFALFLLLIATSSMSKRERVHVPSAFILFALVLNSVHVEAGMLDFMQLDAAKKAYEAKEYKKSQSIYSDFAKQSGSSESYYNSANAFYKQKQYDKAIENYKKAKFTDKSKEANSLSNLGNSYAKKGDEKSLHEAIKQYEESLKLKEDKDTRENLENVKKLLQKKQDQQNKQNKNDKDDKQKNQDKKDQNKNQNQDKQNSQNQKDKKGDDKQNKDSQNQNKQDKKKDEKSSQDKKEDEKKKSDKKKQDDPDKKGEQKDEQSKAQNTQAKEQKMSDVEENKWMDKLNKQQNSYMYRLDKQKPLEENSDEKPW